MAHLDPMLAWDGDQDDSMGYDGQDASMQPGSAVLPTSPGSRQTLSLLDSLDEALAAFPLTEIPGLLEDVNLAGPP